MPLDKEWQEYLASATSEQILELAARPVYMTVAHGIKNVKTVLQWAPRVTSEYLHHLGLEGERRTAFYVRLSEELGEGLDFSASGWEALVEYMGSNIETNLASLASRACLAIAAAKGRVNASDKNVRAYTERGAAGGGRVYLIDEERLRAEEGRIERALLFPGQSEAFLKGAQAIIKQSTTYEKGDEGATTRALLLLRTGGSVAEIFKYVRYIDADLMTTSSSAQTVLLPTLFADRRLNQGADGQKELLSILELIWSNAGWENTRLLLDLWLGRLNAHDLGNALEMIAGNEYIQTEPLCWFIKHRINQQILNQMDVEALAKLVGHKSEDIRDAAREAIGRTVERVAKSQRSSAIR